MVIKKINLVKKNGENIINCYPASSSDVITYEESLTVKDVLDAIVDSVEQIENRLSSNTVYMVDKNGEIIRDAAGTGLVELL
jgi:hypothetical protein